MISPKTLGAALVSIGLALPPIAYLAGQIFNWNVASYGGPPDQGAMVLAYFGLIVASALGATMTIAGFVILVATRRSGTGVRSETLR